jgi:hypothetical protein
MRYKEVTVGADPEFFLRGTDGFVPAVGKIGGSKSQPVDIPGDLFSGRMQEDNVMVEFNVTPSMSMAQFDSSIESAIKAISKYVRTNFDCKLSKKNVAIFSEKIIQNYPEAMTFGCDPDFDAYTGYPNPTPDPRELISGGEHLRFAGGHVHIGWRDGPPENVPPNIIAQFADLLIGLPLVSVDKQGPRRKVYGTAGRYRPKPYGIEYRTPSNAWIWCEGYRCDMHMRAKALGEFMQYDLEVLQSLYGKVPWTRVKEAIDTENEDMAASIRNHLTRTNAHQGWNF